MFRMLFPSRLRCETTSYDIVYDIAGMAAHIGCDVKPPRATSYTTLQVWLHFNPLAILCFSCLIESWPVASSVFNHMGVSVGVPVYGFSYHLLLLLSNSQSTCHLMLLLSLFRAGLRPALFLITWASLPVYLSMASLIISCFSCRILQGLVISCFSCLF